MDEQLSIISLAASAFSISEEGGTLLVTVERTGNISGQVSFNYFVSDGFAEAGEDYVSSAGTLTFEDQVASIDIEIPIINDSAPEIDETFNVQIGEPSVGGELGLIRSAVITIVDNDPPGNNTISFNQANYSVDEDAGSATITVVRSGSAAQAASVEYSTVDDYARAGKDYIGSTSEVLIFDAGETSKTFQVPIIDDSLIELDEPLTLTLSNASGASLGAQNFAKLTIQENETFPYNFQKQIVASGLAEGEQAQFSPPGPTAFDWSSDGTMFIAKLDGVVRVLENGQLLADPFVDLSDQVNTGGQRGLLGLAVHPNFPTSPYIYLAYSYDAPGNVPDASNSPRVTRLVKIEADPATGYRTALANSEEILLETGLVDNFHAAGAIRFGSDGVLYFTHGDGQAVGTSSGVEKAELLSSLDNPFGKMFRIDPLTGQGYTDNPFYNGNLNSIESKIYNYGLRNPWRYALHPDTDEPFIGDVGQATWEEINQGIGEFFGWSLYEGGNGVNSRAQTSGAFNDLYDAFEDIAVAPIYAENHADGARAVVVGDFYTGNGLPDIYEGALFFADFGTNEVKALVFDNQGNLDSAVPFADFSGRGLSYMSMGPDGNLYFADILEGEVGYFVNANSSNTSPNAVNDAFSTNEDSAFTTGNVLANDSDPNGDAIAVSGVNTNGTQGVVTNNGNGTFNYDPNEAFNSLNAGETDTDSFSYTISDGNGGFDTATVTVTIEGVNDGPGGSAVTIEAEDIVNVSGYRLENKPAASGGQMLSLLGQSGNEVGTATFSFNGPSGNYDVVIGTFDESDGNASIDFLQGNNLIGSASLNQNPGGNGASADTKVEKIVASDFFINSGTSFTVQGNENASEHARFDFIRFEPVGEGSPNTPPVAANDTRSTNENADITVNVLNNDTDADGDALTVTSVNTNGTLGQVVNNGNGTFSYSPNGQFNSLNAGETDTDSFSYTISDGNGGFDTATVTVTIEGVNDGGATGTPFTIEAENVDTLANSSVSGYRTEAKPFASGGAMLSLVGVAGNEVGTVELAVDDLTGLVPGTNYDINLGTFNENDGQASFTLELFRNGSTLQLGQALLDAPSGSNFANPTTQITLGIADSVGLQAGDILIITGNENLTEHARLDFIEFTPTV